MGIPVLILGRSGSGKSASMRNFGSDDVVVYNVASKPLPFRNNFTKITNTRDYDKIKKSLQNNKSRCYVIDDSQYLLAFEFFDHAAVKGYDKFTTLAMNFKSLIDTVIFETTPDTIVYFLHHTESNEFGEIKAKTVGKMLDQQLTLEGMFAIVLQTKVESGSYKFLTQTSGNDPCKSPMEMFEFSIDNDLKFVDSTIRSYYGLGGTMSVPITQKTTNKEAIVNEAK